MVLLGACSTRQPVTSTLVGTRPLEAGAVPPGQMDVGELRAELLAFADYSMGEIERLGTAAESIDPSPDTRAFVQGLRADVASTTLAIALEPDAEAALQDLMVSMAAKRLSTTADIPGEIDATMQDDIAASLTRIEKEIWDVGSGLYTSAELAGLRERVGQWWAVKPDKSSPGVVRVGDLPASGGPALSKGLFAPINEANRQIEEGRLLGERFLFLVERLPTIAVWQAEAAAWGAMAAPEARKALDGLDLMATTMERLGARVDSLPMLLDSQREAFLSAFDERDEAIGGLLSEAGTVVRDAGPVVESGERLAGLTKDAAANLSETLETTERLLATLRDPNVAGGPLSLDIDEYSAIVRDFREATEALSEALARTDALSEAPQAVIDHAAWRAAQLMLLLFVLVVVYRLAIPALQRRSGIADPG